MPNIDGKKFPYTQAGKKAAAAYKKKIKPLKKAAAAPKKRIRPVSNSVASQRPSSETLYNMDFGKVYSDAAKTGMRKRAPMPGVTRRRMNYSGRVST
jgi:hypothetical protein